MYLAYKIFQEAFSYDQLMLKIETSVLKDLKSNCATFINQLKEQFPIPSRSNLKTEESKSNEENMAKEIHESEFTPLVKKIQKITFGKT